MLSLLASQYRKAVIYNVDVKLLSYKCIFETQCECAVGRGPTAHCKHVCVVFEAISDFIKSKSIETKQTYIEKLQTFHQTKRFTGSSIKIRDMHFQKSNILEAKLKYYDPRPRLWLNVFRKLDNYSTKFRNMCINFAAIKSETFPKFQLFGLANLLAIYNDHNFITEDPEQIFLERMNLFNISPNARMEIELTTIIINDSVAIEVKSSYSAKN